ncbi:hypothetical protein GCM10027030_12460 [Luteococcus sediminum]
MVGVVGRREHLRLVDEVDAQLLQHLGLDEVPDPGLGHHRDRDLLDDAVDKVGIAHPRHPSLCPDVGGDSLERHHGDRTGLFGDVGLLGGDDVHEDAAGEPLGEVLVLGVALLSVVLRLGEGHGFSSWLVGPSHRLEPTGPAPVPFGADLTGPIDWCHG